MGENQNPDVYPSMVWASSIQKSRVNWLNQGRLALGKITVMDGDPGLGKSSIMVDWAARVTTGRALPGDDGWMDELKVREPRGVVLLSAEDDRDDTIGPRLEIAGADLNRVLLLNMKDDDNNEYLPSIGKNLKDIEHAIEVAQALLLIIDPFMAYLDADTNANRDQDVRRVLSPVASMAARKKCSVLVSRHLNKAVGMSSLHRGGGSIGIVGAARFGLLVAKDPTDKDVRRRLVMINKVNIGPEVPTLVYRLDGVEGTDHARVEWLGESLQTASSVSEQSTDRFEQETRTEAEDWLMAILKEGSVASNEISRAAAKEGLSMATVRRAKIELGVQAIRQGFGKDGSWIWSLPPEPNNHDWGT